MEFKCATGILPVVWRKHWLEASGTLRRPPLSCTWRPNEDGQGMWMECMIPGL